MKRRGPKSQLVGFFLGMVLALLLLTGIAVLASLYW